MSRNDRKAAGGGADGVDLRRTWLLSILLECPFGLAMKCCPLRETRVLPLEKKMEIAEKMEMSEVEALLDYHRNCLVVREKYSGIFPAESPCTIKADHFFRPGLTRQGTWTGGHSD